MDKISYIVVDLDATRSNPSQFRQHPNETSAVSEAKRLASENPEHRFCVFKGVCVVAKQTIRVTYLNEDGAEDLPF